MDTNKIIIKPKKWAKYLFVFGISPAIIAIPVYFLHGLFSSGSIYNLVFAAQIWLVVTFSACILVGIYGILSFSKAEITLGDQHIDAKQFIHKTLPYESIKSVTVRKNEMSVSDGSLKNRISADIMYDGVDRAIRHLAEKIPNPDDITFKGNEELIEKYFGIKN